MVAISKINVLCCSLYDYSLYNPPESRETLYCFPLSNNFFTCLKVANNCSFRVLFSRIQYNSCFKIFNRSYLIEPPMSHILRDNILRAC